MPESSGISSGHERSWRPSPVVVSLTLGVAAVALGIWGYSRASGPDLSASDTLYRTVQLFYTRSEVPPGGTPWQLDVARFLAPTVVLISVLAAVVALTRDRIRRWFLWRFGSGHVLVVGLGSRGSQLTRTLRNEEQRGLDPARYTDPALGRTRRGVGHWIQARVCGHVVALELDASSGAAASLRKTGVTVVTGDGRDPEILRRCSADEAAEIALLTGSDTVNLETLAALRKVVVSDAIPVQVALDDPAVWTALHRVSPDESTPGLHVGFVSVPDRTARMLIDAAVGALGADAACRKLVIFGAGPTIARLAVQTLRASLVGEGGEIVLAGADAHENRTRIESLDPWVADRARITVAVGPDSWAAAELAFVCGVGEAEALAATSLIASRLDSRASTYVAVPDSDAAEALLAARVALPRTELVPVSENLYGSAWLANAAFEQLARARHELHRRRQAETAPAGDDDPARLPWEQLPEELQNANYDFAAGVSEMLRRIGAELVPLTGRETGELSLDDSVLEQLAIAEHERWVEDRRRRGWTYGPERDTAAKLHPSLVSWEELSPEEREKDFESVRGLPEMVASAGYELVFPGSRDSRPVLRGGRDD